MKYIITFLILTITLSCKQPIKLANTTWIGDHTCLKNSNSEEFNCEGHQIRKILRFENDSLFVWHTYLEFINDDEFVGDRSYLKLSDKIITLDSTNIDTFTININQERMTLFNANSTYKSTYRKLPEFRQASNIQLLEKLLTNNIFLLRDSVQYEFSPEHQVITPTLWDEPTNRWDLEIVDMELFVLTGGILGDILHIKEINDTSFVAMTYYKKDQGHRFIKVVEEAKNRSELLGTWESTQNTSYPFELIRNSEQEKKEIKYYEKEDLTFRDSGDLMIKKGYQIDNVTFQTNGTNSILYVKTEESLRTTQWNILNLTTTELVIEKKGRMPNWLDTISYSRK